MHQIVTLFESNESKGDLVDLLSQSRFRVIQGKTPSELRTLVRQHDVHLILLDGSLSLVALREAIHQMHHASPHPTPFVVLNISPDKSLEILYKLGALQVIPSSVSHQAIAKSIQNLFQHLDIVTKIKISKVLTSKSELNQNDQLFSRRLFEIIYSNLFSKQLTINQLADELEISRRQLLRKCYQLYNKSAFELLDETRLQMVHRLVQEEGVSVRSLAADMGYSSPYYLEKKYEEFLEKNFPPHK